MTIKYFLSTHIYKAITKKIYVKSKYKNLKHEPISDRLYIKHKLNDKRYKSIKSLVKLSKHKKYKQASSLMRTYVLGEAYIPDCFVFSKLFQLELSQDQPDKNTNRSDTWVFSNKAWHFILKQKIESVLIYPESFLIYEYEKYGPSNIQWVDLRFREFSSDFIIRYQNHLNWQDLLKYHPDRIDKEIVKKCSSHMSWNYMFDRYTYVDSPNIYKFRDKLNWKIVSTYDLSEELIDQCKDYIAWDILSTHMYPSREFIIKYKDRFNLSILESRELLSSSNKKKLLDEL